MVMLKAAWDLLAPRNDGMTSSVAAHRQPRPGSSTQNSLTLQAAGHSQRRTESYQAERGAAIAMRDGPSQNLRSSRPAYTQLPANHSQQDSQDQEYDLLDEDTATAAIGEAKKAWRKVESLQAEVKNLKKDHKAEQDIIEASKAKVAELDREMTEKHRISAQGKQNMSEEINGLKKAVNTRDKKVNSLNAELDRMHHDAKASDANHHHVVKALQQEIAIRDQQLSRIRQERTDLRKSLEDCKDRIFKMLPVQSVSNDQITSAYTRLFQSIESWLAETFADVEHALNTAVALLMSKDGGYSMSEFVEHKDLKLAQEYPTLDNILLTSIFTKPIYSRFLNPNRICPGLSDYEDSILTLLLKGLADVKPAKDSEAIAQWRVDLHRSLGVLSTVHKKRQKLCEDLFQNIGVHFDAILPADGDREDMVLTCQRIITAAEELSRIIRLSTATFEFEFAYEQNEQHSRALFFDQIGKYDIINAQTGQKLRPGSVIMADNDGRCGTKLATIWPGLRKTGVEELLAKPIIVVRFDCDVQRKGKKNKARAEEPLLDQGLDDNGSVKAFV